MNFAVFNRDSYERMAEFRTLTEAIAFCKALPLGAAAYIRGRPYGDSQIIYQRYADGSTDYELEEVKADETGREGGGR